MKYEVKVDGKSAWKGSGPDIVDYKRFPAEYRKRPGDEGAAEGDEFTLLVNGEVVAVNVSIDAEKGA